MTEDALAELVRGDDWMMRVLRAAETVCLPDWWIGAGFLRNAVWDHLSGQRPRHDTDIDLAYFDPTDVTPERDWGLDKELRQRFPFAAWEARNQARMHERDGFPPFESTRDGIAHWVETATCVGVRLIDDRLNFLYCHGSDDLFGMVARPMPAFREPSRIDAFKRRLEAKDWQQRWLVLTVEET
ncbi:MAG: nucleotidyltransferase family protein [Propioniciclava sp.]|uniref:nucleotidyltransferase family protein n=1 Tax=Propioniciclava sp. TaxID=2038686 RepID=UPI0039E691D8